MLLVTKNKRSQLLFRREPEGDQPPDIVLERPLTLVTETPVLVTEELGVQVDGNPMCSVEGDLTVSSDHEVVLFLVCDKEE